MTIGPRQIIAEILSGIADRVGVSVEQDRARAIAKSIASAGVDDLVLVAGKGHETYQEVAGERQPFSDIDEVERALRAVGR